MDGTAVALRGLTKRYGTTVALDELSFEVQSGTVTAFLIILGAVAAVTSASWRTGERTELHQVLNYKGT